MLVSMTGFGQGEASDRSARVAVEIRTVNHRYLDWSIKMPRSLANREHEIKELLKDKLQRGRITVTISADSDLPEYLVRINVPLMEQYVSQLRDFAKKHSISENVDINTLATLPEVFHLEEREKGSEDLWPLVKKSLKQAVAACNKMREDEGRILETDIRARIVTINRLIKKVEKQAPAVVAHHNTILKERIGKIMEGAQVDRDRWLTEIAILADRLDFSEEVTRLKSHMAQIGTCLEKGGAVSKKLTYLLQEVHREATTISSKASDAEVIECMVSLREESERLREQVQNLE